MFVSTFLLGAIELIKLFYATPEIMTLTWNLIVLLGHFCYFFLHLAKLSFHWINLLLKLGPFRLGFVHSVAQLFDKGADIASLEAIEFSWG